jgi:Uma2 family endonuclease
MGGWDDMTVERASLARREIHLVVEVSDTTLKCDCEKKLLAYESAGVPEYWIVDVPDACAYSV